MYLNNKFYKIYMREPNPDDKGNPYDELLEKYKSLEAKYDDLSKRNSEIIEFNKSLLNSKSIENHKEVNKDEEEMKEINKKVEDYIYGK